MKNQKIVDSTLLINKQHGVLQIEQHKNSICIYPINGTKFHMDIDIIDKLINTLNHMKTIIRKNMTNKINRKEDNMKNNKTGVWYYKEITDAVEKGEISAFEFILLGIIKMNETDTDGCTLSNKELAYKTNKSERTISRKISKLNKDGWFSEIYFDGDYRRITTKKELMAVEYE